MCLSTGFLCRRHTVLVLVAVAMSVQTACEPVPVPVQEPPRPLDDRGLDNLVAFSRLLGYVRHFHPSDASAAADWEQVATDGVRAVESAPDPQHLAPRLDSLFRPLAPGLVVAVGDSSALENQPAADIPEGATHIETWRHIGIGLGREAGVYRSWRIREPLGAGGATSDTLPDPRKPLVVDLGGGVSASIPLAVYSDDQGTLPRAGPRQPADSLHPPAGRIRLATDRATRLAAVALAWNVLQHFYPYFDVVSADWPAELRSALESAATDADATAFLVTLQRMVAALEDGHGRVARTGINDGLPPVLFRVVQDSLVVVAASERTGLHIGEVVRRIDGRPADVVIAEATSRISAPTSQWLRHRLATEVFLGQRGSELRLELADGEGGLREVLLRRTGRPAGLGEPRPDPVDEIRPGIVYVDLDRIDEERFRLARPLLLAADGVIFDLRGYPRGLGPVEFFALLIRGPTSSARWLLPVVSWPDQERVDYLESAWQLSPGQQRITAPVAFLTDGQAISYAESILGIVEHYRLGEIVGEATAGTNGNINPFMVPGGYRITWTGMKVLKHDGSRHHGIGIQPTVPVAPTIAGIRAGRDEVLEAALEVVTRR